MSVPYYETSPANQELLSRLQQQDVTDLIETHRHLLHLEWLLLLLLGSLLIAFLLYYLWNYLLVKLAPKKEQHQLKVQLEHIVHERDQNLFLDQSDQFIRTILGAEQGLTDLELFAYFQGTKLERQSEQALSLLDQGRYSPTILTPVERNQLTTFLNDLINFRSG